MRMRLEKNFNFRDYKGCARYDEELDDNPEQDEKENEEKKDLISKKLSSMQSGSFVNKKKLDGDSDDESDTNITNISKLNLKEDIFIDLDAQEEQEKWNQKHHVKPIIIYLKFLMEILDFQKEKENINENINENENENINENINEENQNKRKIKKNLAYA
ncbi:hypothetical protein M0811_14634 [Anaeramoeba ignava]|uniref:Uncharacterized protein n=1 Tax=Anaeramoeba ignava TaxID=1746090 RepID=A0A9Q0RHS7_ANAIG|nr:hypothetical protein M0811_14634 [Anaeramoeba ignava]